MGYPLHIGSGQLIWRLGTYSTRGELGHSVVTWARTTGHDCASRPSPAEWLLSKKGSNLRSSDLFMAWNYPRCYFKTVCDYQFPDRLGSFKPNCQLAAVGHDCARTTEAAVTVVPVPQTRKITLYRDPTIWTIGTLIPVRHIYIEARPNTLNFNRPQCARRNIMRFVH